MMHLLHLASASLPAGGWLRRECANAGRSPPRPDPSLDNNPRREDVDNQVGCQLQHNTAHTDSL